MSDPLQPDIPARAPSAEAALTNRSGVVEPPADNLPSAGDTMDALFKEEMGREPEVLDNTPDRDRERAAAAQAEELKIASEVPDSDPIENDPDPDANPDKIEDKTEEKPSETAAKAEETTKTDPDKTKSKDFLDDLLPKAEKSEEKPAEKSEADPYESVKLRSDASEKTKDTFAELKRIAKEREQAAKEEAAKVKAEFEAAQKELADFREKTAKLPENVEQELKELREFRATFATEQDPEFKQKYDGRIEANNDAVFEILKKNGLKDELVAQVKQLPKDEQIDQITRWADKLTAREKLAITAKLADNENIESQRKAALDEVRAKAEKVLAEKAEAPVKSQQQMLSEVVETLKPVLPQLPFLLAKEIPATATPKEKEEAEKHNTAAVEAQNLMKGFLLADDARTKGLLALAGVLAPRYRAEAAAQKERADGLQKELDAIKAAGKISRTAHSSAPSDKVDPVDINMSADEALEQAWKKMSGGA